VSDASDTSPSSGMPPPAGGSVQGERHVSDVAGNRSGISKRAGIGVIFAGAAILCGVILLTAKKPDFRPDPGPEVAVRSAVRFEPPPPPPAVVAPVPPSAPPALPQQSGLMPAGTPATQVPPPRPARLLVFSGGNNSGPAGAAPGTGLMTPGVVPAAFPGAPGGFAGLAGGTQGSGQDGHAGGEDMASRLRPTPLTGYAANVLRNQPYLLTMGNMVPCVLQTAMDSTLPGFVTCIIPQDVQGKTGLTLLDRGTRVVGEFRGGVRQGVERLFVVWTRAETPQGVVINLDSPATDPLGRSGLDGELDRHFWQRFGGALLLSTVDGVIQAGVASQQSSGTTTINTGQTQSVIAESLRGTINIPPTIRKNQGELVSIFIARDLDFSTVYRVGPTPPQYLSEVAGANR
jgi:type IV secretion system protein VirB10